MRHSLICRRGGTAPSAPPYPSEKHTFDEAYDQIRVHELDWPKQEQIWRDLIPHILENIWPIQIPTAYVYAFWEPWVKDYHGEGTVGFYNAYNYLNYIWLDQDLKEEMTGQR